MAYVNHLVYRRPRLVIAIIIGVLISYFLPFNLELVTRTLIGWNIVVWLYLILMAWLMSTASHARVRKLAEQEDESAIATLFILSVTAIASIIAIVFELSSAKSLPIEMRLVSYAFTASTLLGSWFLVGTIYTVHYAHLFYSSSEEKSPLVFPGNEKHHDYWDFLYFSFTIAVAAQTSDVEVLSRSIRKTVLAQSVLSFLFNVAIVGLSINIAAGLIGS